MRIRWGALIPLFDARKVEVPAEAAFCLVARNTAGEMVASMSGRFYDLPPGRTLRHIMEDGSFMRTPVSNEPGRRTGCEVTAPMADRLVGRIAYCGALWVHPEYRGLRLAAVMPRLTHACMITLWNIDHMIGFLKPEVIGSGLQQRYGYTHFEPSFRYVENGEEVYDGLLVWMSATEMTDDVARFLDVLWPQIDARSVAGDAKKTA